MDASDRGADRLEQRATVLETVLDCMSAAVVTFDGEGRFVFANPAARAFAPPPEVETVEEWYERFEVLEADGRTPCAPEEFPHSRAVRGEATERTELVVCDRVTGSRRHVTATGRPLTDRNGVRLGGVVVFDDVTAGRRTQAELRRTADELRAWSQLQETYFHSIPEGVVVVDEHGELTMMNAMAERLGGLGAADARPEGWPEEHGIFRADRVTPVPAGERPLTRALGGEATDEMDLFLRNPRVPDGIFVAMHGRPLRDDAGKVRYGVAVFRDVTQRVQTEEALTRAFTEGRTEILDTILHNIGNAINSVVTGVSAVREEFARNEPLQRLRALAQAVEGHQQDWARYLESDPQGQKVIPFVSSLAEEFGTQAAWIEKTMDRVDKRVGHIVDIVRTQRSVDRDALAEKDIVLREAILRAVRLLGESLSKRGYRVAVDCDQAPYEVHIHESRFHQMMVNLLKNAMESLDDLRAAGGLTEKPSIRVHARGEGELLVLDVSDNGAGFKPNLARRLFQAGYTTKEAGSGLGLHATANFASAAGGSVEATSRGRGKGATIRVRLRVSEGGRRSEGDHPAA